MKIVFASQHHQNVATELQKLGHELTFPFLTGSPTVDLETLEAACSSNPRLVIGAAFGGSLVMKLNPSQPIILLAPSYKKDQVSLRKFAIVVHGAHDDIVPVEDSLELQNARIYLVHDTHWFRDHGLKVVLGLVQGFEKQ